MADIIVGLVIIQRLLELLWARYNTKRNRMGGALEVGAEQYKYFILLHSSFFVVLLLEVYWRGTGNKIFWWPLGIFIIAQGLRIWCLSSLGRFWTTRIIILPGSNPITKGPYRFIRHPNYLAVILELAFLPLVFSAWFTAIFFSLFNGFLLRWRINIEEWALKELIDYEEEMLEKPRLIPKRFHKI